MSDFTVVTYGGGEVLREFFNAVAAMMGDNDYHRMIKLSILLAGFLSLLHAIFKRNLPLNLKWLAIYFFAFNIVFVPKVTVNIEDRVDIGGAYTIDNVPLGLAIVASYTSIFGSALTDLTEKNFSLPDDLRYGKSGMVMASNLVTAASQFQITDPTFLANINDFVHQCVFYDVFLGKYTLQDLMAASNIWDFVKTKASPARAFMYSHTVQTCSTGAALLANDWTKELSNAETLYGSRIFTKHGNTNAKTILITYLPQSYEYLTGLSASAENIIQQNMMINAFQSGLMKMGAVTNSAAALQSMAYTKAQAQKQLTNKTVGDMAAYWLPVMKNVFEAIMYGIFVIVFLLMFFPFGISIFKNYVLSLVWIQSWAPLYAIINMIVSYYAQQHSLGITGNTNTFTMSAAGGLAQLNSDMSGLAGYLSMSIPFLATGIVKGMSGVFTQISQYIGGVTQSTALSAAGESASGNFSMGNTSFSNHSAFNTSANHFDTSARIDTGSMSMQTSNGATSTITADGTQVINARGAMSDIGTNIDFAQSMRDSYSRQAENAYNAAESQSHAYSDSLSSGLQQMYELGNHKDITTGSGNSASISTSGGTTSSLNEFSQLVDKFAQDHHVSHEQAGKLLLGASLSINSKGQGIPLKMLSSMLGVSISGNGGLDYSRNQENSQLYSDAQEFVKDTNFTKVYENAERAVKDHSFHSNNEQTQKLLDSTGSSFDQAQQAHDDMMSNYQKAQSYSEQATAVTEKSGLINSNCNQEFVEWLSNQSAPGSHGRMGKMSAHAITSMAQHDPALLHGYAVQFMQEKMPNFSTHLNQMHHSAGSIKNDYLHNNQDIPTGEAIVNTKNYNDAQIKKDAKRDGLDKENIVDKSAMTEATQRIENNKILIDAKNKVITDAGDALTAKSKNEISHVETELNPIKL